VSRSGVAQTYAFLAFVCGSSCVHGVSCLDAKITVDVSMLRTLERGSAELFHFLGTTLRLSSFHNILKTSLPIYELQSRANCAQLCATPL
jgi:hypothetical protein